MDQLLLPGFRFYPTEEELIGFYLHKKLHCQTPEFDRVIPSIDIYNFEPSQLPELAGQICHGDTEQWFFFMTQREREARGGRPTRTTETGYWKATGSPSYVYSSETKVIGVKKTMVFYKGKAPTGRKTKWKMNEYKAIKQDDTNVVNTNIASSSSSSIIIPKLRDELSLCRIYVTSGCARAFDRRPPGVTTTATLNNITSTQLIDNVIITSTTDDYNNHNNVQVIGNQESNCGPGGSQATINRLNVGLLSEKSISSSDSPKSKGQYDLGTLLDVEGISNCNYDDIEMTDSLDDTFIDWEQLGCL